MKIHLGKPNPFGFSRLSVWREGSVWGIPVRILNQMLIGRAVKARLGEGFFYHCIGPLPKRVYSLLPPCLEEYIVYFGFNRQFRCKRTWPRCCSGVFAIAPHLENNLGERLGCGVRLRNSTDSTWPSPDWRSPSSHGCVQSSHGLQKSLVLYTQWVSEQVPWYLHCCLGHGWETNIEHARNIVITMLKLSLRRERGKLYIFFKRHNQIDMAERRNITMPTYNLCY